MNLKKLLLTKNACYIAGKKMTPKGIMVHSTGANNPRLSRYVGPDDGLLGKNPYNNHWNTAKPGGRAVCVHGFIGLLGDGATVATYQTLPWDMIGWHSGVGVKGSANNLGYIGFEICEDGLTDPAYFKKVYQEAVELCAMLCKSYGIAPDKPSLICHSEGNALGIASNHGDVMHWFPKHGKSMDTFRADVKKAIGGVPSKPIVDGTPILGKAVVSAETMSAFLLSKNPSPKLNNVNALSLARLYVSEGDIEGVRGDIAFCQSCVETAYWKFGNDVKPEQNNFSGIGAVGSGTGGATFPNTRAGIRAQIQHLKAYATATPLNAPCVDPRYSLVSPKGKSPMWEGLSGTWATDTTYGSKILSVYAALQNHKSTPTPAQPVTTAPYTVRVTGNPLHIRRGAGTNYAVCGTIKDKGVYTVVEEADGVGAKKWGLLKSGAGWISLDYTQKI